MKTLTATQARANLTRFLKASLQGQDIGIVCDGKIVALRPVAVYSGDYAQTEYGIGPDEMERIGKRINEAKDDKVTRWDGTAKGLRG